MARISRRDLLAGATAGAATLAVASNLAPQSAPPEAAATPAAPDTREARLIELSRDAKGRAHVARAAFLDGAGRAGSLPVSADEEAALRDALAARDFAPLQQRGLRVAGRKFVFIRESEEGAVLHAVRRGEFVTVRATGSGLIIATSVDGMAHPRAVEAVFQFQRRAADGSPRVA